VLEGKPITSMNHDTLCLKRGRFVPNGDERYLSSVVICKD
jgi:hypothetical protein